MSNEIKTVPVLIYIPDNTVKLKVLATIIDGETDELYEAELKMTLPEITEARIEGEEWEYNNVKYTLTDKAKYEQDPPETAIHNLNNIFINTGE